MFTDKIYSIYNYTEKTNIQNTGVFTRLENSAFQNYDEFCYKIIEDRPSGDFVKIVQFWLKYDPIVDGLYSFHFVI